VLWCADGRRGGCIGAPHWALDCRHGECVSLQSVRISPAHAGENAALPVCTDAALVSCPPHPQLPATNSLLSRLPQHCLWPRGQHYPTKKMSGRTVPTGVAPGGTSPPGSDQERHVRAAAAAPPALEPPCESGAQARTHPARMAGLGCRPGPAAQVVPHSASAISRAASHSRLRSHMTSGAGTLLPTQISVRGEKLRSSSGCCTATEA